MNLTALIEAPMGSTWKYEQNKKTGRLTIDRPINQPVPYHYGYILGDNLCEDGDPIDIFVVTDAHIYPLTEVPVEIIGVIKCLDNGKRDDKLIGVVLGDCRGYETMGIAIIKNYLETYKEGFKVIGEGDKEEAIKIYEESVKMYREMATSDQEVVTVENFVDPYSSSDVNEY